MAMLDNSCATKAKDSATQCEKRCHRRFCKLQTEKEMKLKLFSPCPLSTQSTSSFMVADWVNTCPAPQALGKDPLCCDLEVFSPLPTFEVEYTKKCSPDSKQVRLVKDKVVQVVVTSVESVV
jgi:hypothetical protein